MNDLFSPWWTMTSAYFAAPLALLGGNVQFLTILPTVGIALFVAGLLLAAIWREKKAPWLILPVLLTALAPVVIGLGNLIMGWFGVLFVLIAGGVCLLIWIGVLAGDASRRLPIWLVGLGLLSFVAYCAFIAIALIWGAG